MKSLIESIEDYSVEFSFEGLGTKWCISTDQSFSELEKRRILYKVKAFDDKFSRFKANSLLSQLSDKLTVDYDQELSNMLEYAIELNRKTGGVLNIKSGGDLRRLGYGEKLDLPRAQSDQPLSELIKLSAKKITIDKQLQGSLDFGSFGKGWLVDELAEDIEAIGITKFIINAGGDIVVGPDSSVEILISNPFASSQYIGSVELKAGHGLGCSGISLRNWLDDRGKTKHHIIDLNSGDSFADLAMVCVEAPNCLLADSYATAMMLLDRPGRQALARAERVPYLEVSHNGNFETFGPIDYQPNK